MLKYSSLLRVLRSSTPGPPPCKNTTDLITVHTIGRTLLWPAAIVATLTNGYTYTHTRHRDASFLESRVFCFLRYLYKTPAVLFQLFNIRSGFSDDHTRRRVRYQYFHLRSTVRFIHRCNPMSGSTKNVCNRQVKKKKKNYII